VKRKQTVRDLGDVRGTTVFARVDYNVPLEGGRITDDTRIRASLPTLEHLLGGGARLVLASHLGRPKKGPAPEFSLKPAAARLSELLKRPVGMASDCVGPAVKEQAGRLRDGDVLLLENVRFHKEEEANDAAFARALIADTGATVFVNDAFGSAHRAHASTEGVSRHVKRSVAGLLMEKELRYLGMALEAPEHPFVAVLGGAKVSDKLGVIRALLEIVDSLVIGGGMCFTFLAAQGRPTGASLLEEDQIETCRELLASGAQIHLPSDLTALGPGGKIGDPGAGGEVRQIGASVPDGWMGLDIGPGSAAEFSDVVLDARTVFWNGPMGVFEDPRFEAGTRTVAEAVAETRAFTVVGGGDSAAAVAQFGLADRIDHISTGGGASLELLEQGDLPGLEALRHAHDEGD
jgi:phosphoglycerate kinase